MLYRLARHGLFRLDAERAHELTIAALARLPKAAGLFAASVEDSPVEVMGLQFRNPVGLAAGLDKDAECLEAWSALGFGFVEVGTVTPRPQPGNPRPRMFRLPRQRALINRLGFNSKGLDYVLERIQASEYDGVLGVNIGKNADTPLEQATADYLTGLRKVYPHADYVTVNLSSPNTPGLRELQQGERLDALLHRLKRAQTDLAQQHGRYVPLVVKIDPDQQSDALQSIATILVRHAIDGVCATNTTVSRPGLEAVTKAREEGGLSGAPLAPLADETLARLASLFDGSVPIIGLGGVMDGEGARRKFESGASLVQIYTGFIYRGPGLIRDCVKAYREFSA